MGARPLRDPWRSDPPWGWHTAPPAPRSHPCRSDRTGSAVFTDGREADVRATPVLDGITGPVAIQDAGVRPLVPGLLGHQSCRSKTMASNPPAVPGRSSEERQAPFLVFTPNPSLPRKKDPRRHCPSQPGHSPAPGTQHPAATRRVATKAEDVRVVSCHHGEGLGGISQLHGLGHRLVQYDGFGQGLLGLAAVVPVVDLASCRGNQQPIKPLALAAPWTSPAPTQQRRSHTPWSPLAWGRGWDHSGGGGIPWSQRSCSSPPPQDRLLHPPLSHSALQCIPPPSGAE